MVDDEREDGAGNEQELDAERVVVAVVRGLELDVHEINGAERRGDVEDLHQRVVQRDEVREEVQVARHKHQCE